MLVLMQVDRQDEIDDRPPVVGRAELAADELLELAFPLRRAGSDVDEELVQQRRTVVADRRMATPPS